MILYDDVVVTTDIKTLYIVNGINYLTENAARYQNCTHIKCGCGNGIKSKGKIYCDFCEPEEPIKELPIWDENNPVYEKNIEKYFYDISEIEEYLDENECTLDDMNFCLCEPNYLYEIDENIWENILAEDYTLPKNVQEKINELNKTIREYKTPISFTPLYNTKVKVII
jgi:hypothetical protein